MSGLLIRYAPFAVGAALLAVLVHILVVLALPAVALRSAGVLLGARAGVQGPEVIPPGAAAAATPFADPAMASALCPFDLADGAFRVRAPMSDGFGSLAVVSSGGVVLHGLTDKAAVRRVLDVVVGTDLQIRALEAQDPEDRPVQEIRLRTPAGSGLVIIRALVPRASDAPSVVEMLKRVQCGVVAEP